jgi:hypothetical protein
MTTLTKPKQPKRKKTPSKKESVFTKEDFLKVLDKVISTPVEQVETPKKQPEKVKSEK